MTDFLCIKNVYDCNLNCWFCSTCGTGHIKEKDILRLWEKHKPREVLLIGGEPMILGRDYYLNLLESGVKFSMQTNLTLYDESWNDVISHENFTGISVSGDKESEKKFFERYNSLRRVLSYSPPVLIVLDGDYYYSLSKAKRWLSLAILEGFPLRVNYLQPLGRARKIVDKLPKVSEGFDVFFELIDMWKSYDYPELQPHSSIMEYIVYKKRSVCPFISFCCLSKSIVCVEVDLKEYPCPALGDLKMDKRDVFVDLDEKCLCCDFYELCRGCYIRNWEVFIEEDTRYCSSASRFFRKMESLKEDYERKFSSICKAD